MCDSSGMVVHKICCLHFHKRWPGPIKSFTVILFPETHRVGWASPKSEIRAASFTVSMSLQLLWCDMTHTSSRAASKRRLNIYLSVPIGKIVSVCVLGGDDIKLYLQKAFQLST